jgi:hypothetical protein
MVGFISHAFVGQLADQMGHMSILSHVSTIVPNNQTTMGMNQNSEVNSMQSMQPNNPFDAT